MTCLATRFPRLLGLLLAVVLIAAGGVSRAPAYAKDPETQRGTGEKDARRVERRKAIREGCAFLAGMQRKDGGFGDNKAVVALTALSVLALMADGSTDGRGPYGQNVKRGIDFLLKVVEEPKKARQWHEGYFDYPYDNTSRMHGQGYATLALATALGTAKEDRYKRIRAVLEKAVACCEHAQTTTGGYGYTPIPSADHEGSVTVAVAQGLRAARDAGMNVSAQVISRGLFYLKRSQKQDGSFKYSTRQDQSTYALTAAALSSFFLFGVYHDDADRTIQRGIDYMRQQIASRGTRLSWYYYGHFYAAWACWQWDGHTWVPSPDNLWGWWQSQVYTDLLGRQTTDGSFYTESGRYNFGPVMSTAFAVLTLAIPDEVLPIFQR